MTFKLSATRLYWWTVKVRQPIDNPDPKRGAKIETVELKVQFEAISQDDGNAHAAELRGLPREEREKREHELIERAVKNWEGVVDDENQPVPFSLEAFRKAMQFSWFRIGIYEAWVASTAGEEARRKN